MFKRYIIILNLLFAFAYLPIYADDCTDGLTEAKALYNNGNYQKAKELFEYVKSECPQNYTEASNWIAKCDNALKPKTSNTKQSTSKTSSSTTSYLKVNGSSSNSTVYLMNTSSSKTITISCSTSYSIYNIPSWCSITNRTSTSFTLNYQANPNTYTRYGSIDIYGGGTNIRLSLEQAAKSSSSSSTTTTNVATLKVNKSYVYAPAKGGTEYITVTSKKPWEIQFPSGGMYTAKRIGDIVEVVISANTTTNTRTDFFNIRTTDGKETIKISLSQSGQSSKSSYNNYSNSKRSNNAYNSKHSLSKYQQYTRYCGDYEITWFGMRAGICTGISYGYRLFSFRLGPVQINPIEIAADYNFIEDEIAAVYTPSVDFFIPFQDDAAFYFGAGPSIHISDDTYAWADVSVGVHWHWGNSASSDFFMRYNGSFMFGVSIQWSTDY
jgi:hypothetical protein